MTIGPNDPRYSPVMLPPRADAPKVAPMKPVKRKLPTIAEMVPPDVKERLAAVNSMFNPVETIGGSMRASQRMLAPGTDPWGRVGAAGDMLSGVAGFVAPMVAAAKVGAPAANAVVDSFTGSNFANAEDGGMKLPNKPGYEPPTPSRPISGTAAHPGGPLPIIKAYHGSPHDFDKFSLDKIGTGEGAQAYGHGLYFAENENIARSYRDALAPAKSPENVRPDDIAIAKWQKEWDAAVARKPTLPEPGAGADAYAANQAAMEKWWDETDRINNAMIEDTKTRQVPNGRMYEVNINADPADFLDWDKPLSEQPPIPRAALDDFLTWFQGEDGARQIYDSGTEISGLTKYSDDLTSEQLTAAMKARGIPGIKYLDAGSRNAGDGSRNYVVFDDKLIDIVRKYGIAGLMMMGGAGMQQQQGGI